ncbi:MAG: putative baseplate assembly protein [Anaerolineae bacterium]|nr:putative baseplate assembly protein [Anaerolineae bacterium]
MSIPSPVLDDLRFQHIVNEARLRIHRYCPEWTDYNLSDPGVTLIELFAWMTEMITFRLNQVPVKNHIHFLNMLGEELSPPKAARTLLTFYLAAPLPIDADDPTGVTVFIPSAEEVATLRVGDAPEVIFTTDSNPDEAGKDIGHTVRAPTLTYLQLPTATDTNYWDAERRRVHPVMPAFSPKPVEKEAFYIGFDKTHDLRGYILKLNFRCDNAKGSGILGEDPPWRWECWATNDQGEPSWKAITLSQNPREKDTTGGLNNASGALVLYLPRDARPGTPKETQREAYWVRCMYQHRDGDTAQAGYDTSPEIQGLSAEVIGISVPATHAQTTRDEFLGKSNGEPGQTFALQHQPVLRVGEVLEVSRDVAGRVSSQKRWHWVKDFAGSDEHARHFTLDAHKGEIAFGPSVIQPNDKPKQYGRVPASGSELVLTHYQFGGGSMGNVPAGSLHELRRTLPYVDRVTKFTARNRRGQRRKRGRSHPALAQTHVGQAGGLGQRL